MTVLSQEMVYMCDIDGTLVSLKRYDENTPNVVQIYNYAVVEPRYVRVHKPHVQVIEEMLARGRTVIFWSGSGYLWAKSVVERLGLNHPNAIVMTKPIGYMDDLDCSQWMGNRLFIKDEELENG